MSCEARQEELTEQWLSQPAMAPAAGDPALRDHVRSCAACTRHLRFLEALATALASDEVVAPNPATLERSRTRAARALRAHQPPRGFGRELAGTVVVLALGLPIAVAQAWWVAQGVAALLEPIVPSVVLAGLGVFYGGTFLLMVGTLYAFVPLWVAAVRRARTEAS